MSARLEDLAQEKDLLITRSSLYRLRLRRATNEVRNALHWKRMALTAAAAVDVRRLAFGVVLSLAGLRLGSRAVQLAGRALVAAKLARSLVSYLRAPRIPAGCDTEQTDAGIARNLKSPT